MKLFNKNKILIGLSILLFSMVFSSLANAQDLLVDDIKVSGLQRVSSDVVFSVVDVKAGMTVNEADVQQLIRDLFATEFFSDVQVSVSENILVVNVVERPVIALILIEGNDVIPTESLIEGLNSIELGENEVFKLSALEAISKQLSAQYSALGRYAAQIETFVKDIGQNQVQLGIRVREGEVSTIKHINIVGNTVFDESVLRDEFSLNTTGTWSWISGNDKYAREKLAGDLERLRSFYLNRGYLQFNIESSQVALSPNKKTVYITVKITEGEQFTVDQISLAGDLVLPESDISSLITLNESESFSQLKVTESEQAIIKRLSDEGYSSVNVSGTAELDEETKTAQLVFFIDPGAITYVRRITFVGNEATSDSVLRREMRQIEGAPVSTEKLRLSKLRLERLGLFSQVNLETLNVAGSNDQIDVIFTVAEQSTASVTASIGYSNSNGVSFGAGLQHNNWLGTGNTFGINVEQTDIDKKLSLNFNNPYFTKEGVSRGVSFFFRERDFSDASISQFATNSYGANVNFGYPISETGRVSLGLGFENTEVQTGENTVQEIQNSGSLGAGGSDIQPGFLDLYGNEFNTLSLNFGWSDSTFNRGVFPTEGFSQRFNTEVALPLADLEFYKLSYNADAYFPVTEQSSFRLKGRLAYASPYGDLEVLPFFENYFSGGIGSVRGFEPRSLGPKGTPASEDDSVSTIGGDTLLELSAEIVFPAPFVKDKDKVRTTFFVDAGNVFSTNCGALQANCSEIDPEKLSITYGFSLQWLSPIAPLSFSFARPLVEHLCQRAAQ